MDCAEVLNCLAAIRMTVMIAGDAIRADNSTRCDFALDLIEEFVKRARDEIRLETTYRTL